MENALAAYPAALPLLTQAAEATDYDPQHDFTYAHSADEFLDRLLPQIQANRRSARVLSYHAKLLRRQGDFDGALRGSLVAMRLGRHLSQEPLIVSYLVSLAVRRVAMLEAASTLLAGEVSVELRQQLDAELERQIEMEPEMYRDVLKQERAFGMERFQELTQGVGGALLWWRFKNDQNDYLTVLAAEMEMADEPYYDLTTVRRNALSLPQFGAMTALFVPALAAARASRLRVDAVARCLRVLSALQTHPLPEGALPPDLTSLGLPAEVSIDPCDGQPLRVQRLPAGWLVYSVGENQIDDGGQIGLPYKDVGVGPAEAE